jgi:DNA repair protein RadC
MVGDVRGGAAADLGDRAHRTPFEAGHVAARLSGHGGGVELSDTDPSRLGNLVGPSTCEERRTVGDLLAFSGTDAPDCETIADLLMREFGSFAAVLAGSTSRLRRAGADENAIDAFRWCRRAILLSLKRRAVEQPVISTSSALRDYLHVDMSTACRERLRTLYLNARNELLLDHEAPEGTVDAAPFYPREIVGRALEVGATALILVHNHPSGDPRPSRQDIDATRTLAMICGGLGITLIDHLIVGRCSIFSFRNEGLLS